MDDDRPAPEHTRPDGLDDQTVKALGTLSEALEEVEQARGLLYAFHRHIGHADLVLGRAVEELHDAGHDALAAQVDTELIGRNVLPGRWTFQVVEEFDADYYALFTRLEQLARDQLVDGRRHLFEAEMKEANRTHGAPGHEARPSGAQSG